MEEGRDGEPVGDFIRWQKLFLISCNSSSCHPLRIRSFNRDTVAEIDVSISFLFSPSTVRTKWFLSLKYHWSVTSVFSFRARNREEMALTSRRPFSFVIASSMVRSTVQGCGIINSTFVRVCSESRMEARWIPWVYSNG